MPGHSLAPFVREPCAMHCGALAREAVGYVLGAFVQAFLLQGRPLKAAGSATQCTKSIGNIIEVSVPGEPFVLMDCLCYHNTHKLL